MTKCIEHNFFLADIKDYQERSLYICICSKCGLMLVSEFKLKEEK